MKTNNYELKKVIKAIRDCTEDFRFGLLLSKIKQAHVFKYNVEPIHQIALSGLLDTFVISLYRFLMMKLALEHFQDSSQCGESELKENLIALENQFGPIIKEEYCLILENIKEKKSESMQFIFFLVCFSVIEALSEFCDKSEHLNNCLDHFCEDKSDQLQNQLCVLANYQVTGIMVKQNVYKHLKKKYYHRLKPKRKNNQKMKTGDQLESIFHFFTPIIHGFCLGKENEKKLTTEQNQEKSASQFRNQLKSIFTSRHSQNGIGIAKRKSQGKDEGNVEFQVPFLQPPDQNNIKRFSSASLRNSNAFKERRLKDQTLKENKNDLGGTKFVKRTQGKVIENKSKKNQKRNLGLNLISASLKLFFMKSEKKSPVRPIEKCTIAQWKKKIKSLKNSEGFSKASLMNQGQKLRKRSYGTEQDQKFLEYQKFCTSYAASRTPRRLQSERKSIAREGFCEFIDQRQSNQIGIVRSIINFSNNCVEKKHKKICSQDLKHQYSEFNRKAYQHEEDFLNENNYMYRLQKALTGTNKF